MKKDFTLHRAEHSLWHEYFSKDSLPFTVKNLKCIRDMAIYTALDSGSPWDPQDFITLNDMLTWLESLAELHYLESSEIMRAMLPKGRRLICCESLD